MDHSEFQKQIEKYLKITYLQVEEDWYQKEDHSIFKQSKHSVKQCDRQSFGSDEPGDISDQIFSTWYNDDYKFNLFCPDFSQNDLYLYNEKGTMQSKSIMFKIELCQDEDHHEGFCKKDIDEFIKDITIQFWTIEQSIDMNYYHEESYTKNQKMFEQTVLKNSDNDQIPMDII